MRLQEEFEDTKGVISKVIYLNYFGNTINIFTIVQDDKISS